MSLQPLLPVISGESLTSYLNRVAHFHFNMGVYRFLEAIELPRSALLVPQADTLHYLSTLLGQSLDNLAAMAFQPAGGRTRVIAGEVVSADFTMMKTTSFCPRCLLEDSVPESPSKGMRIGRVFWQIAHVRTCSKHHIELVRQPNKIFSDGLQIMSEVAPDDAALETLASERPAREPSALQSYIEGRLNGGTGPAWLDDQPIDLAARACEMLGVVVTAGTHVNLLELTASDWDVAGDTGYNIAKHGPDGIRDAMSDHMSRIPAQKRRGGPQHAFGRLYQWIQFGKSAREVGPIREVFREFLLDTFPLSPGTDLFGEPVDRQRVHTVQSLAKTSRLDHRTVHRAVVLAGILEGDPDQPQSNAAFEAAEAEDLVRRLEGALSIKALQGHLNCNRIQAQQLVHTGVLPFLIEDAQTATGALKTVAREDADAFLARLVGQATRVTTASEDMTDIVTAAEVSRWPVMDIVQGILSGLFARIEIVDPSLKFKGILVNPEEVRLVLSRHKAKGYIGIEEAAAIIGMPVEGVNALLKLKDASGGPYLSEYHEINAKRKTVRLFPVDQVKAFRRGHVSLKEVAETYSLSPKIMKRRLDDRGVVPLAPRSELGRVWYRKADIRILADECD